MQAGINMNYLAHLYLSGNDEQVATGNFIGDYVKGNQFKKYPEKIREGILLHRKIDTFTDTHPYVADAKALFRNDFGLYSGIVVDFFYDHFLAARWTNYSEISLRSFAKWVHATLLSNYSYLPSRVQGFLPFLIQHKRLESYASVNGTAEALKIMSRYSSLPDRVEDAQIILVENYDFLEANFTAFMQELMLFVDSLRSQPKCNFSGKLLP